MQKVECCGGVTNLGARAAACAGKFGAGGAAARCAAGWVLRYGRDSWLLRALLDRSDTEARLRWPNEVVKPWHRLSWSQSDAMTLSINPDDAIPAVIAEPEVIGVLERCERVPRDLAHTTSFR